MTELKDLRHSEHMTEDEIGLHAEQFHNDLALLRHQQTHAVDANSVSAEWCADCGNEIPEARRKAIAGVSQCIDCAREAERKERLGR